MRHLTYRRALALVALPLALVLGTAAPAAAHEFREVGDYQFVVGWGDEPTYAGFKNSVQLILADADGEPVVDLGDTLNVEVSFGDQTIELAIAPNFEVGEFGEPGDYRAFLVPTRPGTYTFHFTGTIGDQDIDETFTSSETTFDDAEDPKAIEFPVQDPSNGELAERLDQETARVGDAATAAASNASDAEDTAGTAQILGIVGTVVGLLGLAAGAFALRRSRA
jgi:hypothetical protein